MSASAFDLHLLEDHGKRLRFVIDFLAKGREMLPVSYVMDDVGAGIADDFNRLIEKMQSASRKFFEMLEEEERTVTVSKANIARVDEDDWRWSVEFNDEAALRWGRARSYRQAAADMQAAIDEVVG